MQTVKILNLKEGESVAVINHYQRAVRYYDTEGKKSFIWSDETNGVCLHRGEVDEIKVFVPRSNKKAIIFHLTEVAIVTLYNEIMAIKATESQKSIDD